MKFSNAGTIVFTLLLFSDILVLLFLVIFNRRRKRIVNMNHRVTGNISDIKQRFGMKGNIYYEFVIRYYTLTGSLITINHFSIKKPKEDEVILYYNPAKPEKFVLKNDGHFRTVNILFGTIGVLFLIGAICALFLL